jgi:hypothetical protein
MYKYFLFQRLKKFLRQPTERKKTYRNLKNIQTILVFFNLSDYEEGDAFVKRLQKLGKVVTAYIYQDNKKMPLENYAETTYRIVTVKEVNNLFNSQIDSIVAELNPIRFDAAFDLTIQPALPIEYLLAHCRANIKVGYKKNNFPQYDLTITSLPSEEPEAREVRELGTQIIHYLQVIQAPCS